MATNTLTAFVALNLDTSDDLDAVADGILDELVAAGYDVISVDFRDDVQQTQTDEDDGPSASITSDILAGQ